MDKILVFTMQKVGSSSVIYALKDRYEIDRGYEENVSELSSVKDYDAIYTLVRDPVARNISWFFEVNGNRLLQESMPLEHIKGEFMAMDQTYPLTWFDEVFLKYINIDVYKYSFPVNGVLFLGKICILRTDQMQFQHRADTIITRSYGALYKNFLDWVKFPREFLDKLYQSKYVEHFFKSYEIVKLYERWLE